MHSAPCTRSPQVFRKEGSRRADSGDYPVADEIDNKYTRDIAADGADKFGKSGERRGEERFRAIPEKKGEREYRRHYQDEEKPPEYGMAEQTVGAVGAGFRSVFTRQALHEN